MRRRNARVDRRDADSGAVHAERFRAARPEPMSDPAPESVAPVTGRSRLTARTPASAASCESALSGTTATWPAVPSARRARPPSCWIVDSKASPRVVRTMTRDSPRGALARARRAESRLVERDSEAGVSSVAIASESTMPTTSRLSTKLSWCDTEELPQSCKVSARSQPLDDQMGQIIEQKRFTANLQATSVDGGA